MPLISPLAGFQFYAGRELWDEMKAGDTLVLVREPDNAHDANAVRVVKTLKDAGYEGLTIDRAAQIFEQMSTQAEFAEFLTLPLYEAME